MAALIKRVCYQIFCWLEKREHGVNKGLLYEPRPGVLKGLNIRYLIGWS
jgi:hypothetical protein